MDHALHRVTSFAIVGQFVLDVRFDDGTRQRIDFRPVLRGELYGPLRDIGTFERVAIDPVAHTLVWPNGADFDPATLHDWPDAGQRMIELVRHWPTTKSGRPMTDDTAARHRIIGIDCATEGAKTGLALAVLDNGELRIDQATVGDRRRCPRAIVLEWLTDSDDATLLAIDAPLGWPEPLVTSLTSHTAGARIAAPANCMFRRETDRFVQRELRKTPLDVGADRIARTAHAALRLLGELRDELGAAIPLAWQPSDATEHAVIEVYPAATLEAHGIRSSRYKATKDRDLRGRMLEDLHSKSNVRNMEPPVLNALSRNADMLDAAVCALAAADFISGRAMPPPDRRLAEREGWIWVARRATAASR